MISNLIKIVDNQRNANKFIVGAIHTMNSNTVKKWEKVTTQIKGLSYEYNYPMILYIDINSDVHSQAFIEFENKRKAEGWMVHKSNT